jgi:hypothetical protein
MELDFDLYSAMENRFALRCETHAELVLSQIAKATEELGETASAYLTFAGYNPRKDAGKVTSEDVVSEVTDTIGTLLVLLSALSSDPSGDIIAMQQKFSSRLAKY